MISKVLKCGFVGLFGGMVFASSDLQATEKYKCHFQDGSDETNITTGDVELLEGFDPGKEIELNDGKNELRFQVYVGLVQISIWQKGSNTWTYLSSAPEEGFSKLGIDSRNPKVIASCKLK